MKIVIAEKKLVDQIVEECTETVEEMKIACILYIFNTFYVEIGTYFVFFALVFEKTCSTC